MKVQSALLTFALIISFLALSGFVRAEDSEFFIIGKVANIDNNNPVENQLVIVESDTAFDVPHYFYVEVTTNENGFFKVTVPRPGEDMDYIVHTIDCNGQRLDTVLHYYHDFIIPNLQYETVFKVCVPEMINCDPDFYYVYDSTSDGNYNYHFFDMSGSNTEAWRWDFGDGTIAFGQNPIHQYSELGIFDVKLTILSSDIFGNGCEDSITKVLNVGGLNYYSFGGQVFDQYFPVREAELMLYKIEEGDIVIPVDTTTVTCFGDTCAYYFYMMPEGDYLLKAALLPTSSLYGEYIPTYYGDEVFWTDAAYIHLHEDEFNYDIHLIPTTDLSPGQGMVTGNISFFNNTGNTDNEPANDIELVLSDGEGNLLECTFSNANGEFRFFDLPWGDYTIRPDYTGMYYNPADITLTEQNPIVDDVDIILSSNDTTTGPHAIHENISDYVDKLSSVYPNPFTDITSVKVLLKQYAAFEIAIYNQVGQLVYMNKYEMSKGEHAIPINLDNMHEGLYTLQLITKDRVTFNRKIIKLN